jgi:hypothetical protein
MTLSPGIRVNEYLKALFEIPYGALSRFGVTKGSFLRSSSKCFQELDRFSRDVRLEEDGTDSKCLRRDRINLSTM